VQNDKAEVVGTVSSNGINVTYSGASNVSVTISLRNDLNSSTGNYTTAALAYYNSSTDSLTVLTSNVNVTSVAETTTYSADLSESGVYFAVLIDPNYNSVSSTAAPSSMGTMPPTVVVSSGVSSVPQSSSISPLMDSSNPVSQNSPTILTQSPVLSVSDPIALHSPTSMASVDASNSPTSLAQSPAISSNSVPTNSPTSVPVGQNSPTSVASVVPSGPSKFVSPAPPTKPSVPPTITEAWTTTSSALSVIACVAIAIWFHPC